MTGAAAPDAPARGGPGRRSVVGLDLLRFAAAALVMLYHLACTQWLVPSSEAAGLLGQPLPVPALLHVASLGWIGVPIFFVISGFVIVLSAADVTAHRFLVNRALRLLPCAWFCATASFALALAFAPEGAPVLLERYLRTLVLFPAPRWIDGVYWTLGIEISFYALVYALLAAGRSDRLEVAVSTVGVASALIWCLAATPLWPGLDVLASTRVAKLALVTHGCEFALGVLIWAAAAAGWTLRRIVTAALCIVGALLQIDYDARFTRHALGHEASVAPPWEAGLVFLGFLALFLLAVRANEALFRRLGRKGVAAIRAIGLSTYPLYLLHTFVGALAMRAAHGVGCGAAAALAVGVATAIIAAFAVSELIEPRIRAGLRRSGERLFASRAQAVARSVGGGVP